MTVGANIIWELYARKHPARRRCFPAGDVNFSNSRSPEHMAAITPTRERMARRAIYGPAMAADPPRYDFLRPHNPMHWAYSIRTLLRKF
jgi:hypothetical protein